ncbi:MAG: aspartate aminotransferase family protein [Lachnospiraceae bacterium]|nr:aspartate aminotransferase family protein [Lachnospiraceae bacterium]
MTTKEYINEAEESLLHTYNRYQIVLEKGDGVYLYDTDGKKYLDFASGIAVFAFGYNNKEYNDGLKSQIDKLIHTSNLFYNVPASTAACRLKKLSGMDRVFFTNSGTEAIEGAVKTVRKYGFNKDGRNDHEIIAMKNSFHGRSMGSLSVTGNAHYQDPFKPLIGGVKFAEFNNLESVKELITDRTCGIILEPVQGEGGVFPGDEEFIKGIRKLCDENDILLVFDEIQCGMGRTGKMFAHEYYGVKPDVLTLAKALGCGFPVGAFLTNEKAAVLLPGDHGTTYGGNPLACAAVNKVLDLFENTDVLSNVNNVSTYLDEKLQNLVDDFDFVKSYRGKGLLKGLVIDESVKANEIILKALDEGLIVISASGNVLRMVPPLVITRENIDEMYEKLNNVLKTFN